MAQRRTVESIQSRPSTPQPQDSSLSEPHPDQSAQDEGKHRHHLQQKLRSPAPQPDQDKPQPLLSDPSPSASPAPALLVQQPSSAGSAQAQTYSSTPAGTATTATSSATATATATSTASSTPTPDLQQPSKDASSATTCTPPVEIVETGAGQSSVRSGDQGIATDSASTTTTHQDPRAPSESAPPLADTVSGQHQQYNQQHIGAPHNGSAPRVLVPTPMSHPQQPPGPPTPRQTPTMNYPAPSPYPPAGMPPGAQYAYGAQVAHVDPYRTNQTALPSMRTFDHVQQQQQQQHPQHQMPLPNHMTVSMAPNQMSYYAPMHPAYQMHPGQGVVHYALTGLTPDPRIALSGGRHKKVPIHCTAIARRNITLKCHHPLHPPLSPLFLSFLGPPMLARRNTLEC